MNRLLSKRALITGGTTGIGLAMAKEFAAEGASVMVTGLNEETLATARDELGNQAAVERVDAGDVPSQKRLVERVRSHFGQLDIAVLNAGIGIFKPLEQWD